MPRVPGRDYHADIGYKKNQEEKRMTVAGSK